MSDSLYQTNYDEGYVGDGQSNLQQTPLEDKQMYFTDYEDNFVPRLVLAGLWICSGNE